MFFPAKSWSGLLALGLLVTGCSTTTRQASVPLPDWRKSSPSAGKFEALPPPPQPPSPKLSQAQPNASAEARALPSTPGETWIPLPRWCRANGLPEPERRITGTASNYALRSTNGVFVLGPGRQSARWEDIELRLGFSPQLIDGQPYVHALDLKTTLQPLLFGSSAPSLGFSPVLVIDPGHGGENAGAKCVVGEHYEKEYTLDWAVRLQGLLVTNGWRVYLTRSSDADLALSNRVSFATAHKADLFVSLHFNSTSSDHGESGVETYCLTPAGMPSTLTRGFADETTVAYPNNAFDRENLLLAVRVHQSLLRSNGYQDRGVRHARFPGVLRGQERPAILIEGGYLSNPREARQIAEPAHRQKLAEAVARALQSYVQPQHESKEH